MRRRPFVDWIYNGLPPLPAPTVEQLKSRTRGKFVRPSAKFMAKLPYSSLEQTVMSHGWIQLTPFEWDDQSKTLRRRERVGRRLVTLAITQKGERTACCCYSRSLLPASAKRELRQRFLYMIGHEIQLEELLSLAKRLDPN